LITSYYFFFRSWLLNKSLLLNLLSVEIKSCCTCSSNEFPYILLHGNHKVPWCLTFDWWVQCIISFNLLTLVNNLLFKNLDTNISVNIASSNWMEHRSLFHYHWWNCTVFLSDLFQSYRLPNLSEWVEIMVLIIKSIWHASIIIFMIEII
jgi:hypothetical protein